MTTNLTNVRRIYFAKGDKYGLGRGGFSLPFQRATKVAPTPFKLGIALVIWI
jgi:hypothetical protein